MNGNLFNQTVSVHLLSGDRGVDGGHGVPGPPGNVGQTVMVSRLNPIKVMIKTRRIHT